MSTNFRTIDVLDYIRAGRDPFSSIMAAVNALGPEEDLVLIAPFEPVPLFHVLRSRGFSYSADRKPCGDWEVLFSRAAEKELGKRNPETPVAHQPNSSKATSLSNKTAEVSVEIDARGLEPPQP